MSTEWHGTPVARNNLSRIACTLRHEHVTGHAATMQDTDEQLASLLETALIKGDSDLFLSTARALAWARIVSQVALRMGMPRQQVSAMLDGNGPLTLDVAMRLVNELHMQVAVLPRGSVKSPKESEPIYVRHF
jgi:DNA-binding phage protein